MARNDMNHPTMKISYNAPVALTFALLSLITLAANYLTAGWTNHHLFSVYQCSLADPLAWVRFFGHVLGHSGYGHYIGNMVLILVLGPNLEDRFGSWILVAIFYLGGELWDAIFVRDNISQLTHIIGGLCGTVLGFALSSRR